MKRSNFAFLSIILLVLAAGCSSPTVTNPTPQVNYVQGTTYIYYAQDLDANTGLPKPGSGDTITSKVLTTDTTYQGMTNVTVIQNTHGNPGSSAPIDTTYISQSNGNYWHYNYGLEIINGTQAALLEVNSGKQINAGWVLQAQLSASPGTKWAALNTNLTITIGTLSLNDTATETIDTDVTVGNEGIFTKHSIHSVELSALGGLVTDTLKADTYVSATDGPVLDIFNPTMLESTPTPGRITVFLGTK
jgi:hypothetical protein